MVNVSFSIPDKMAIEELVELGKLIIETISKMKGVFFKLEILGNVKKLKDE